jgi:hypothetical protein
MRFRMPASVVAVALLLSASACDDDSTNTPGPTTAQYELVFEATWSAATHPTDFPSGPHFSGLIGASHEIGIHLWRVGEPASPGIKNMAERGLKSPLSEEIDTLIEAGDACHKVSGGGINPSPGSVSVTLTVTRDCPAASVVSMIAPSPDWFVGTDGVTLYENGEFVDQKIIELYPHDAGTDSGASYASPDEVTSPPVPIYGIEVYPLENGGSVAPLGTFTFTRIQ